MSEFLAIGDSNMQRMLQGKLYVVGQLLPDGSWVEQLNNHYTAQTPDAFVGPTIYEGQPMPQEADLQDQAAAVAEAIHIRNHGISGHTTTDMLGNLDRFARALLPPDIRDLPLEQLAERVKLLPIAQRIGGVIFAGGTNDAARVPDPNGATEDILRIAQVSEEQFAQNIVEFIRRGRLYGIEKFLFAGLPPVARDIARYGEHDISFANKDLKRYEEIARQTCLEQGVGFVAVFDQFPKAFWLRKILLPDGLHMGRIGQWWMKRIMKHAVAELVGRP